MKPTIIESRPSKEWNEFIEMHRKSNGEGISVLLDKISELGCTKVLYRKENENFCFAGCYNENESNEQQLDNFVAVSLKSVYGGRTVLNPGQMIWNVLDRRGSDPFHRHSANWIALWRAMFEVFLTDMGVALPHNIQEICSVCGNINAMGAHVVLNPGNVVPIVGSNGVVHIVPLCAAHNNWNNMNAMALGQHTFAVILNNYHQ